MNASCITPGYISLTATNVADYNPGDKITFDDVSESMNIAYDSDTKEIVFQYAGVYFVQFWIYERRDLSFELVAFTMENQSNAVVASCGISFFINENQNATLSTSQIFMASAGDRIALVNRSGGKITLQREQNVSAVLSISKVSEVM